MSQPAPSASRREVLVVLPGLLLVMLLAMLDNMIVGTAMPTIVGEIGGKDGVNHLSWVVTAYILASTVTTPLYGKLGDLYGRKRLFMGAIVVFLVGSALCGTAGSMGQLIGYRALQGLGAGGLMVGVMAIIGDMVPPRERGKYQGYIAAVMSLAMIGGPLIGGFLTDHASWRWAFYVNLPLGGIALVLLAVTLPSVKTVVQHKIDYLGIALLTATATALVLMTSWGGSEYAWGSAQILGLGAVAAVGLVAFVFVELKASEPVLPLHLFRNRNFSLSSGMGFLQGFAMFGSLTFLPLFMQYVQGASATNSGLLLMPMMLSAMALSLVAGQLIAKTGKYRIYPIIGSALMAVGLALLTTLSVHTTRLTVGLYMVAFGAGLGLLMQIVGLIAQNAAEPKDMGVASSTSMFFRSIGGSFGVSIFGSIYAHQFAGGIAATPGAGAVAGGGGRMDPKSLAALSAEVKGPILQVFTDATTTVFAWAILFAVLSFGLALFVKHVPLRGAAAPATPPAEELVDA